MLRNNQKNISRLFGQFDVMFQRNFASKIRRSKKSMTSKNIHAETQLESDNGIEVPLEEPLNAHFLKCQIGKRHKVQR